MSGYNSSLNGMDQDKPEGTPNHGKRPRPLLLQPSPKVARTIGILKSSKKFAPKKSKMTYNTSDVPASGTPVPEKHVRKAGPYLLGPKLGPSPVKSIVQCLARKERTDDFYQVNLDNTTVCLVNVLICVAVSLQ